MRHSVTSACLRNPSSASQSSRQAARPLRLLVVPAKFLVLLLLPRPIVPNHQQYPHYEYVQQPLHQQRGAVAAVPAPAYPLQ